MSIDNELGDMFCDPAFPKFLVEPEGASPGVKISQNERFGPFPSCLGQPLAFTRCMDHFESISKGFFHQLMQFGDTANH